MEEDIKIAKFLEEHRGEKHLIVLHATPDPDAISSAYAHRMISSRFGIDTTILYSGKIGQRQNVALMKLLGIDIIPFTDSLNLSQYQGAVFVDNQGTTDERVISALEAANVPVLMVIDHAEPKDRLKPPFRDIRKTGSTATIYTEYFKKGLVELDKSRKDHIAAATAMLYGILADTDNFVTATDEDFRAAAFLSRFRDAELLDHIMSQARSKQVMDIIRRALGDRVIEESYSIAGIGYLRSEDRDAIPQAADFLLTEENVHTAIVFGIMHEGEHEEFLIGSMRTSKITISPDEFLSEVFGNSTDESKGADISLSAGGFYVPIGFLAGDAGDKFQDLKWQVYHARVKQKIFSRIGVSRDVLDGKKD